MKKIQVKICGITRLEDAFWAIEAGADMLGFNFYPESPRFVTPLVCERIVSRLRQSDASIRTVGVFVNAAPNQMHRILEDCGLDLAQLSGDESLQDLDTLGKRGFKALRPPNRSEASRLAQVYARQDLEPALLLDAHVSGRYGGTSQTGDWGTAREMARRYPILLAGGLRLANLENAITLVHPWGVDVASGVEAQPGIKDFSKMQAFVQAARRAAMEESLC